MLNPPDPVTTTIKHMYLYMLYISNIPIVIIGHTYMNNIFKNTIHTILLNLLCQITENF